jgi:hypothetical protein
VITKLKVIVDELFLATILGFFERDKRLEKSTERMVVRENSDIEGVWKNRRRLVLYGSRAFYHSKWVRACWSINHMECTGKRLLDNFHNFKRDFFQIPKFLCVAST